jgi:hypothetical protein
MKPYDVIGNIVDEKNNPLIGVIVDDGSQGVPTDINGYFAIKTDKNILNFRMIGYKDQKFDLSKYKSGSSVNVDIQMKPNEDLSSHLTYEDDKSKRKLIYGGISALILGSATFFISKRLSSSKLVIGSSSVVFASLGYLIGAKYYDYYWDTIKKSTNADSKKTS